MIILTPTILLLGVLAIVSLMGLTINLDKVRPMVEKGASAALDRQVAITGSVELLPTLNPRIEVQGVRINNPQGWGNPDFIVIKLVRLQLGLLDLLKKELSIDEITAEGVDINLESRQGDQNNWSFAASEKKEGPKETGPALSQQKAKNGLAFKAVDSLSLKDIAIRYQDTVLEKTISFQLDELSGKAEKDKSIHLQAKGNVLEQSYRFDLNAKAQDTLHPQEKPWPLTLSGNIAGTPFSAKGKLEQENKEQQLSLDVFIGAVDIGALLSWLTVAESINASTKELGITLKLKGESLHELLSQSAFNFSLQGGDWIVSDLENDSALTFKELDGDIGAQPGEPIILNLNGKIDATPISIAIQGMPLIKYISDPGELPISIAFSGAGTELTFNGAMELPITSRNFNLGMTLQGDRLKSLDELLRIDLPPFGPYSLHSQFAATDTGYNLSNLAIKVGSSDLTGSMNLNSRGERPEFKIELVSNILQINDFALGDWKPEGKKDTDTDTGEAKQQSPEETKKKAEVTALFSPEALAKFNGTVSMKMAKVLSGKDTLGSGLIHSTLEDGRFSIAPLQLDLAEGTAKLEFSFYPTATEAQIHLGAIIDNLDLGIRARRTKQESTMGGILNLDIELDSTAPALRETLAYGKGHFDLAFAPVNFDASIIDLWAVNLLSSLASEVDGAPTSVINCLVASFGLEEGLMQERTIFMDTTQMSIEGEANINFKTEELKLKVRPKAKRPEFFSLATPVNVCGTFDEFGIGVNKLRLTTTVASFLTSPIHVPLRRLFSGKIPADGKEACRMAWDNRNLEEKPY